MTDNVESLIIELLRALRSGQERIEHELRELKSRITSVEAGIASLRRDSADFATTAAEQHARYDRLADRIDRIEKRLELQP
jgi:predicted nuclease with TOPRIM domain